MTFVRKKKSMAYFNEKIVWIIGASSGIGEELAKQLAAQGATIVLSGRNFAQLELVRQSLDRPETHVCRVLELERHETFAAVTREIWTTMGRIDFLFNNGGISQRATAFDTDEAVLRKIMEVNFFGNVLLTQHLLPYFRQQGSGHIVVTSSIAGKFGFYLRSGYSASKHALQGYYESVLLEEAVHNISVTLVVPGKINTPISTRALNASGDNHGKMDHNQATGMPVETCVKKLLEAVAKKKKEILIGNKEIIAVYIKRFFPGLFWKIIRKQSAT